MTATGPETAETTIDGPGETAITLTISGRYVQGIGTAWVDGYCIASSGSAWLDGAQLPTGTALAALVMGY